MSEVVGLNIALGLSLPREAATWVIAYLAKRGAGKTYNAAVQAEEMVKAGIPIGVIDGMGIWWGLRVSADGKGPGLPIVVFGGEHADLPLVPERATEIAKAIVESNISFVLDLSGFSKNIMRKILMAFLDELYRINRVERHIFIEEADMFAPQKPFGPEAIMCLSSVDNFIRRGGNHNLGCTLITQRTAVLNKDVLTQADCLVILRTLAPQDKEAIQAWVKEQTEEDKEKLKTFYDSLKDLENGEAWVWRPEKPTIYSKVKFRRRETFHATREFILNPQASQIKLMNVGEFVAKFKAVFEQKSAAAISSVNASVQSIDPQELEKLQKKIELLEADKLHLKKLAEDAQKSEAETHNEMCQFRFEVGEKLQAYEDFVQSLVKILPAAALPSSNIPVSNVPGEVVVVQEIPELIIKVNRPVVTVDEGNWRGRLVLLVAKGFFDDARRLTPVREKLQQNYGAMPNNALINNELVTLVKMHLLDRKQENGQWVYFASAKAKDRIKEAS